MIDGTGLFFRKVKLKKKTYMMETGMVMIVALLIFGFVCYFASITVAQRHQEEIEGKQQVSFSGNVKKLTASEMSEYGVAYYNRYVRTQGILYPEKSGMYAELTAYEEIDRLPYDIEMTGSLPENETEILLPTSLLESDIEIGDKVVFQSENGEAAIFSVSGTYRMTYAKLGTHVNKAFTICSDEGKLDCAEAIFKSKRNIELKADKLAYVIHAERVNVNPFMKESGTSGLEPLLAVLIICAVIFMMYSMIKSSIAMRKAEIYREFATLRSLGVRKTKILRFVCIEGIFIGLVGGIIGSILSAIVLIGAMILSGMLPNEAFEYIHESLPISFALGIFFTALLKVAAQLFMYRKPWKMQISELLAYQEKVKTASLNRKNYRNPVWAYIRTSLTRNYKRILLSIVLFSGSIFFFIGISGIEKDFAGLYGEALTVTPPYNISVSLKRGYSEYSSTTEIKKKLEQMPEVEAVAEMLILAPKVMNIDESFAPLDTESIYPVRDSVFDSVYISLYTDEELEVLKDTIVEGSVDIKDGGCVLVNYSYSVSANGIEDFTKKVPVSDKKVGDSILLADPVIYNNSIDSLRRSSPDSFSDSSVNEVIKEMRENGQTQEYSIRGIVKNDLRYFDLHAPVVIISDTYFRSVAGKLPDECKGFQIRVPCNTDVDALTLSCKTIPGVELVMPNDINFGIGEEIRSMTGIMNGLLFIAILAGFVNILCTIMLEWEISRKEFAILKSVGATKEKIIGMIAIEKAIVCVMSAVMGTLLGVIFDKVFMKAVWSDRKVPFALPVKEMVISFAVMLLITALATMFQSGLLKKMNISEVLKAE